MTIGTRLREERERIGITQADCSERGGVSKRSQLLYEQDRADFGVAYMTKLSESGFDINYIVTGNRADTIVARVFENSDSDLVNQINLLLPKQREEISSRITALRAGNFEAYELIKGQIEAAGTDTK